MVRRLELPAAFTDVWEYGKGFFALIPDFHFDPRSLATRRRGAEHE